VLINLYRWLFGYESWLPAKKQHECASHSYHRCPKIRGTPKEENHIALPDSEDL
jgi:hypothetical protein